MRTVPALSRLFPLLVSATLLLASATAFADVRHYTATAADGVVLAVQESGDPAGRPLVFVHGLLGSHLSWDAQLSDPALQRYRLIAYDLRGHGQSGQPQDPAAYTDGRRWADDLAAVLVAADARGAVLVGWSLGAAAITQYLATHGDEWIDGAVYVGGVIELDPDQIAPHPDLYRDLASTDLKTHLDAERAFLALCFRTPPGSVVFQRLLANAALASATMQRAVHGMSVDAPAGLGAMRKPLLLIYGAQDALVRAEPAIARARALNPRASSLVYPDSGHAPFLEETDRFDRDLAAFVDALDPAPANDAE
ncbi:alpha/beta fold hydrolase [Luteimonas huabeiensis]|uniref:alpha/beta fold hydrolase n=1 Tax=Luteimonas huabeiensis TaxID=1244513 RepID=UPI0004645B1D|nr:alpha/beta hydrolase [Luteimonas huabeiensis]